MSEKNDRKNAKLGFFVLISLVLFLVAIFFIGSARDLFNPTFEVHAIFEDVEGLTRGNNVRLSGVKIGTVRDVEIFNDSLVAVTLKIKESDRRYINKDAMAVIGSEGLIGNTIVVIQPGSLPIPVEEDDTIASLAQTSAQDIMNTLETTGQNVKAITQDLQLITQQILSGEGTIGRLISSPELANNIEDAVVNLETTSQRTARITRDISQMVNKLQSNQQGPVYTLLNDTTFANTYDSLKLNIRSATDNVVEISGELEQLSNKLNREDNTLGLVLTDTTFASNLEKTAENAAEGTENFNESLEALQQHWLLRGFFRKKNKEK